MAEKFFYRSVGLWRGKDLRLVFNPAGGLGPLNIPKVFNSKAEG